LAIISIAIADRIKPNTRLNILSPASPKRLAIGPAERMTNHNKKLANIMTTTTPTQWKGCCDRCIPIITVLIAPGPASKGMASGTIAIDDWFFTSLVSCGVALIPKPPENAGFSKSISVSIQGMKAT